MFLSDLQHRPFQEIYTLDHASGTYKLVIYYNRRNELTRWRWNTPPPREIEQIFHKILRAFHAS